MSYNYEGTKGELVGDELAFYKGEYDEMKLKGTQGIISKETLEKMQTDNNPDILNNEIPGEHILGRRK